MKDIIPSLVFLLMFSNFLYGQIDCSTFVETGKIISITDTEDYVWCGTESDGLFRIDKSTLEIHSWNSTNSIITSNRIKSVIFYLDQIHFSSDSTIMVVADQTISERWGDKQGMLLIDAENYLIIAGRRNFYIYDSNGILTYEQNLIDLVGDQCCMQTTDAAIDASGNIWLTHWDFYEFAMMKFDGTDWAVFDSNNSILPIESPTFNQVECLGNKTYTSNWGGIFETSDDVWSYFHDYANPTILNDQENMDELTILALEIDAEDRIWVAGNNYDPFI